MALQFGSLRDALLEAGTPQDKANAAAEEVAGYENRLTRLTTLVEVAIGILVVLLGSQAALWAEMGKFEGKVDQIAVSVSRLAARP